VAILITDPDPYCDTGKTRLGRGMHCRISSSYLWDMPLFSIIYEFGSKFCCFHFTAYVAPCGLQGRK